MTTFDDREQAFEAKFAHDEDLRFRAAARCNRLLGIWAADLIGHKGRDAEAYAATVVSADLQESGHEDILRKLIADLAGLASEAEIRGKHQDLMSQAAQQILAEA